MPEIPPTTSVRTPACAVCGQATVVRVDSVGLLAWRRGALIQKAFPEMPIEQRELLISGTHPECWATITEGMDE
jgi:hypothetical protein